MSTKDTIEDMARNTWLAGLGSFDSSKEVLGKSIDAAQEKSNSLYNELLNRGEKIQNKINDKKDELQAKGKNLLGMSKVSDKSNDEKIAQLNAKVDALTTAVVALIEKRNAAAIDTKKATKKAAVKPKTAAKATSKKVTPESAIKTADKAVAKTTKTAEKVVAKSADSVANAAAQIESAAQTTAAKVDTNKS